jgi:hypothetical protein
MYLAGVRLIGMCLGDFQIQFGFWEWFPTPRRTPCTQPSITVAHQLEQREVGQILPLFIIPAKNVPAWSSHQAMSGQLVDVDALLDAHRWNIV